MLKVVAGQVAGAEVSLGIDEICRQGAERMLAVALEAEVEACIARNLGELDEHGHKVVSIRSGRAAGYAPSTVNRRMAAVSGLFAFGQMRDPEARNPVPRGAAARRTTRAERSGMLGHLARPRSQLRVREPRRLPRGLDPGEIKALFGSFRTDRDRAIAGLMLFSGLRSAEVLGLEVTDVDIGRGWIRVIGKGDKERRVPLDSDVAGLVQTYLLAERPETAVTRLFVVAKGPHRGQPLRAEGRAFDSPTPSETGVRIVWVHSSSKAGNDAATRARRIEAGTAAMEELAARLAGPRCR